VGLGVILQAHREGRQVSAGWWEASVSPHVGLSVDAGESICHSSWLSS
jgi:hypothetical protein